MSPNDPSAGAVAIMVIFTAPFGGLLGCICGAAAGQRWQDKIDRQSSKAKLAADKLSN
jgi:hypothetical protein